MLEEFATKKFDVILLIGQSNASGSGLGQPEYAYKVNPRIYSLSNEYAATVEKTAYGNEYLNIAYTDDYGIKLTEEYENSSGKGKAATFAFFFAEKYLKNDLKADRDILIVEAAIGGTGFSKNHWGVGDPLYERAIKLTRLALSLNPENRLITMLWHQGEHDSYENAQFNDKERFEFYYGKLSAMLKGLRRELGVVPFIGAGFTKEWYDEYERQCKAVYSATEKVFGENPACRFITDTFDLDCNHDEVGTEDYVHFGKKSLITLGERYYNAFKELSAK